RTQASMPGASVYRSGGMDRQVGRASVVELPPRVWRGRLTGMLFDTDKSFLLPSAMTGIRGLKRFYDQHPKLAVLVSGHADRVGGADYNLTLSNERAQAIADFLRDRVDGWMPWYHAAQASKRWDVLEDQYMLSVLPENVPPFFGDPPTGAISSRYHDAVRAFQVWSNQTRGTSLMVDGRAGDQTRRELIASYMALEETSLPVGTPLLQHGCGEFHNEVPTVDDVAEPRNRRVEVFLFDGQVDPSPKQPCPAPGCPEYPEWLRRVVETVDFDTQPAPQVQLVIRLLDASEQPRAGVSYTLRVGDQEAQGVTDAQGRIDQSVPRGVATGVLTFDGHDVQLTIGGLEDATQVKGMQQRLNNLGYDAGDADGELNDRTRDALRRFQSNRNLAVTGTITPETRQRLMALYGQ
ncbi:MAG TPA: peptidoglycan-binding protein, partial [Gemmatimonadaceae bacterium]